MNKFHRDRLDVVGRRLGEAVLDPSQWTVLMEEICHAAGTTGAGLLQSDIRTPDIPRTASTAELFRSYFDNNFHLNDVRAVRGVPLLMAGNRVVGDAHLFRSQREMLSDPLYAHLSHLGFRWWAAVGFRAGSALWGLSLQRKVHEGPFETSEMRALEALSQRLTETATLSQAVGRLVISGMTGALNRVRQPAVALDRHGFVIDSNAMAADVFDDDLRVTRRRLSVRDKQAQSALDRFVDQLRTTPDTAALPAPAIVVRRTSNSPVVIRVLPVDGAASGPFLGARAILTLSVAGPKPRPEPTVIAQAYGLTPAEARLAALIASGASLERAADELGIGRETVRNQLKAVFAKTGTHRQAELVALLSSI